ncbi:MAG: hypothetical protein ACO1Q7_11345 [Gemmatimonas sp.]
MFLLGAFLTGGAVGYAVTTTFSPRAEPAQLTPAQMRDAWKTRLELTAEQAEQFDALYNTRRTTRDSMKAMYQPAIDSIIAIHTPKWDSVRTANHAKVMSILTPKQQDIYRQMIEEDNKKADSIRNAGAPK